jgi:hypothetical protein
MSLFVEWSLDAWLKYIDLLMVQYKSKLEEYNFDTEKALAVLQEKDADDMGIKGAHKHYLVNAVAEFHCMCNIT